VIRLEIEANMPNECAASCSGRSDHRRRGSAGRWLLAMNDVATDPARPPRPGFVAYCAPSERVRDRGAISSRDRQKDLIVHHPYDRRRRRAVLQQAARIPDVVRSSRATAPPNPPIVAALARRRSRNRPVLIDRSALRRGSQYPAGRATSNRGVQVSWFLELKTHQTVADRPPRERQPHATYVHTGPALITPVTRADYT